MPLYPTPPLQGRSGGDYTAVLQKAASRFPLPAVRGNARARPSSFFSGDLTRCPSFVIASSAATMGRPVTMFFTFWGLTALRENQRDEETPMEAMFGKMPPRRHRKLPYEYRHGHRDDEKNHERQKRVDS